MGPRRASVAAFRTRPSRVDASAVVVSERRRLCHTNRPAVVAGANPLLYRRRLAPPRVFIAALSPAAATPAAVHRPPLRCCPESGVGDALPVAAALAASPLCRRLRPVKPVPRRRHGRPRWPRCRCRHPPPSSCGPPSPRLRRCGRPIEAVLCMSLPLPPPSMLLPPRPPPPRLLGLPAVGATLPSLSAPGVFSLPPHRQRRHAAVGALPHPCCPAAVLPAPRFRRRLFAVGPPPPPPLFVAIS